MKVTLASFGGIVPRDSDHQLIGIAATIAHDVKLRNGRLEAWREPCPFADVRDDAMSFHLHGCCVVAWPQNVTAAEVAPDWGRFYITGHTNRLEAVVATECHCTPTYYYVGVPAPTVAPTVSAVEECSRASDARSYVYTYMNQWFEESAPSPASGIVRVDDDSTVQVTGLALPPDGYGIKYINLYRTATGYRIADGKTQTFTTDYLLVATLELPSTSFTDNVRAIGLGPALETDKVEMPPDNLGNVCSIGVTTRLAGTVENRVYFSEPHQLHNWPIKYELTLDSTIVHMRCWGMKLFVTTDTTPYVIDASNMKDILTVPVQDLYEPLPDIACVSPSSAIATPFGLFYSSPRGIILIDPQAKWHIVTSRWFNEEEWSLVRPQTVRMAYWEGFLFIVTDTVTFLLDINGDPYGDMKQAELVTLSDSPVDLHVSTTGKLMMLKDGVVSVWNTGAVLRKFIWESRELTGGPSGVGTGSKPTMADPLGYNWSPVSAKIRTDDTLFTLKTPTGTVYQRKVVHERPFRLPRIGRHLWYKVRLEGTSRVEFVDLGTANFTVNSGA